MQVLHDLVSIDMSAYTGKHLSIMLVCSCSSHLGWLQKPSADPSGRRELCNFAPHMWG
jgi:hypothetical protein